MINNDFNFLYYFYILFIIFAYRWYNICFNIFFYFNINYINSINKKQNKREKYYKELSINYEYIREIPDNLDVNDILFLNNKSFMVRKNIKLLIIQLYLKGLINITKENNKIIIKKEDKLLDTTNAEEYMLNYITNDNKNNFNYQEYSKMVKKDILKKGLAYDKIDLSYFKFYFLFSSIVFLIFAYFFVTKTINSQLDLDLSITTGFILLVFPSIPLYYLDKITHTLNLSLTNKGWYYKSITKAYKKFLKDFSRIDKLKTKNYPLWQKHLLYAQALDINLDYYNMPNIDLNLFDEKDMY